MISFDESKITQEINPNVDEYKTDAVKNTFIVYFPYDFPYVEEVGKAIGPNIQLHIGFLGFHSWITDDADAYTPGQKNCASKYTYIRTKKIGTRIF